MHSRDITIDSYRGIGIIFVILGHASGIPNNLHDLIYSFHMPAFFILSGYLFNHNKSNQSPIETIISKFYRLIIPAWTLGLLCAIPYTGLMVFEEISLDLYIKKLAGTLSGYPQTQFNFQSSPLWFLFALFIIEVIAIASAKLSRPTHIAFIFLVGIAGIFLSFTRLPYVPFNLITALTASAFYALGMLVRASTISNTVKAAALISSPVIFLITNWFSTQSISMAENDLGTGKNLMLNIASALSGTILLYFSAKALATPLIAWIGARTLPILGFNYYSNILSGKALSVIEINNWLATFTLQTVFLIALLTLIEKFTPLANLIHGRYPSVPTK